jgi:hypothetical protein
MQQSYASVEGRLRGGCAGDGERDCAKPFVLGGSGKTRRRVVHRLSRDGQSRQHQQKGYWDFHRAIIQNFRFQFSPCPKHTPVRL